MAKWFKGTKQMVFQFSDQFDHLYHLSNCPNKKGLNVSSYKPRSSSSTPIIKALKFKPLTIFVKADFSLGHFFQEGFVYFSEAIFPSG